MKDLPPSAVLTGDLVRSTDLAPADVDRAMAALAGAAARVERWPGLAPTHFTRHRGDGWQVVVTPARFGLRAALLFRAALRATDARFDSAIGLATGAVARPLAADLNRETGPAFVASGRALEEGRATGQRLVVAEGAAAAAGAGALAVLLDRVGAGWSRAQAEALVPALAPEGGPDLTALGRALGKSRQAVTKALHAAWAPEIGAALARIEAEGA